MFIWFIAFYYWLSGHFPHDLFSGRAPVDRQYITVSAHDQFLTPPVTSEILRLWPVRPAVLLEKQSNRSDKGRNAMKEELHFYPPLGLTPSDLWPPDLTLVLVTTHKPTRIPADLCSLKGKRRGTRDESEWVQMALKQRMSELTERKMWQCNNGQKSLIGSWCHLPLSCPNNSVSTLYGYCYHNVQR